MIQKVEMYQAVCDGCGKKHSSEFTDEMACYMGKMCGWEEIDGKFYCPGCVKYDEETDSYKPKKLINDENKDI